MARAGKGAKIGSRAGRIARIIRLIRLIRIVKLYKNANAAMALDTMNKELAMPDPVTPPASSLAAVQPQ